LSERESSKLLNEKEGNDGKFNGAVHITLSCIIFISPQI